MKRILIGLLVVALIALGIFFFIPKGPSIKQLIPSGWSPSGASSPLKSISASPGVANIPNASPNLNPNSKPVSNPNSNSNPKPQLKNGAESVAKPSSVVFAASPVPSATSSLTPTPSKAKPKDGVDGNVSQPGDDGDMPPESIKAALPKDPAGVKGAAIYLVASDLRNLPNVPNANRVFEAGVSEGSKSSPWKNRSSPKSGDALRVKENSTATFVPALSTAYGKFDAVALCTPGVKECVNSAPSQLRLGGDVNQGDHWLSGSDKSGKGARGGGSFTVMFVAARASANANPLIEHQNGEAGANKGPFLGWIGPDLVGSIHGSQGVVGVSAVSVPSVVSPGITPQIFTLRFDRKKEELRLMAVGEKVSESTAVTLAEGEGPDNDEYAAIAMGSKNPGSGAITYVFEQATYAKALSDKDICRIHKEWNSKYSMKIDSSKLKPCE
ncbi:MAG: hypothetical protein H7301_09350 [Cryobacterium sp.]|nr:hypothetical protein [Oligoflexia bacterium]